MKFTKTKCTLMVTLMLSSAAYSQDLSSKITTTVDRHSARLGYKIGNGVTFSNRHNEAISIDFPKIKWNVSATCSGWDAGLSVSNILDDVEGQFQNLQVQVVNSITGFVTQLPLLLLQRQDPGLYELISSTVLNGEDLFNLKIQSCEQMSERFSKGNGFGEMSDEAFWYEFSSSFTSETKEDTDVVEKLDEANENKSALGVTKHGGEGKCAGEDMEKCDPVTDVVKSGVAKLFNDALNYEESDSEDSYSVTMKPWVAQVWDDTEEAETWITDVIGTVKYATCEDCEQMEVTAGQGVYSDIAREAGEIYGRLLSLVESGDSPSQGDLEELSSNEVFVDTTVIEALRAERSAQSLFIRRISEDVGLMRVVDKLLASRRVLLVGSADPYFQSISMNVEIIDKKIDLISDEVKMLSEELKLKKMARGDALEMLLSRHESRQRIGESSNSTFSPELREKLDKVN